MRKNKDSSKRDEVCDGLQMWIEGGGRMYCLRLAGEGEF